MRKQKHIDGAVGLLQAEVPRLGARLEALKTESAEVQAELDRVRGALAALGAEGAANPPPAADAAQPKPPKVREPGKSGLIDREVMDLVAADLARGAAKTAAELKAMVLEHVKATGRLGTGVHLTLARVLRSGHFEQVGDSYRIVAAHAESA